MKKFLAITLCFMFFAVGLIFTGCINNQNASAVMTLETNPEIQLVLDQNNKVMSVNAINEDGEKLMLNVNFVGKTAEEAAKLFAEASTKFDKIDLNTTGGRVEITIACEDDNSQKYAELKTKVTNKVNSYFKEMGIMAGAVVNVTENIQAEIQKLGYDALNYANKSFKDIMKDVEAKCEELEDVALANRDQIFTKLNNLKSEFSEMFNLEEIIDEYKQQIKETKDQINQLPNGALKETAKKSLKSFEDLLEDAEKDYKVFKKEYEEKIEDFVVDLQEQSETTLNNAKIAINNAINAHQSAINAHLQEIENLSQTAKNQLIADIEAYQNSLNA